MGLPPADYSTKNPVVTVKLSYLRIRKSRNL